MLFGALGTLGLGLGVGVGVGVGVGLLDFCCVEMVTLAFAPGVLFLGIASGEGLGGLAGFWLCGGFGRGRDGRGFDGDKREPDESGWELDSSGRG